MSNDNVNGIALNDRFEMSYLPALRQPIRPCVYSIRLVFSVYMLYIMFR